MKSILPNFAKIMNISTRISRTGLYQKPVPRHEILRNLHGKRFVVKLDAKVDITSIEFSYLTDYYEAYKASQPYSEAYFAAINNLPWPRRKLSRVLPKINPKFDFSNLVSPAREIELTFSTNYKDILRCAETNHFKSCFAPNKQHKHIPVLYLRNPSIAIAYNRDKHGNFSSRVFLYLLEDDSILIGRPYGLIQNGISAIFYGLKSIYSKVAVPVGCIVESPDRVYRKLKFHAKFPYSDLANHNNEYSVTYDVADLESKNLFLPVWG